MTHRVTSRSICLLLGLATSVAAASSPATSAAGRGTPRPQPGDPTAFPHADGRVIVRFADGASAAARSRVHAARGATVRKRFRMLPNLEVVTLPPGTAVADALAAYGREPAVLHVEPDYTVRAEEVPDDPEFDRLWGLHNTGQVGRYVGTPDADIDAPEAWDVTTGSSGVVVAVIDTGTDLTHPDLVPNLFRNTPDCNLNSIDDDGNGFVDDCFGIDTRNEDSRPLDDNGHGTHVAGTIGAVGDNALGVAGVSRDVRIMSCKFLSSRGEGSTSDAIACLDYVAVMKAAGVNVVATNNSWGGGGFSVALLEAIEAHRALGILFVASAGNSGRDVDLFPQYPASYYSANVVTVAATRRQDLRSTFSNYGRRTVHLGAPGEEIVSTWLGGGYTGLDGTSMAAPHVSGVAALLAAQNPAGGWWEIRNLLLTGGDTNADLASTVSGRRLNAHGALTCAGVMLLGRLRPVADQVTAPVGAPLDLSALHVTCASPGGEVDVTVAPGSETVTLHDDGLGFDQVVGDGVYSGQWTPAAPGVYQLTFTPGEVLTVVATQDALLGIDPADGANFGQALARVGTMLAVGAPGENGGAGAVHVYDAATRAPIRTLAAPDGAAGDRFGWAVAALGDDILVGAPFADVGGVLDVGGAYLFDGATGALLRRLDNPVPLEGDFFGFAVLGIAGNALVGAPYADDLVAPDLGAAYLFDPATGALLWTFANPNAASLTMGWSLAAMGSKVLVGAPGGSNVPQSVHLFDADPASAGFGTLLRTFASPIVAPPVAFTLFFGSTVVGLEDRVAIADPVALVEAPAATTLSGAVFIFDAGSGALLHILVDPAPAPGNLGSFGAGLAAMGADLAVGAPETNWGDTEGAVYRFGLAAGELLQTFRRPLGGFDHDFGASLASLDSGVITGAPLDDTAGPDAGAAYFVGPAPRHRLKCYKAVARASSFTPSEVQVADALETKQTVVQRPASVCAAASQAGSAVEDAEARLACYRAQDADGQLPFAKTEVVLANVFGRQRLQLQKASALCLSSGTDGGPSSATLNHYKCYKAASARGEPRFVRRDVVVDDPFATGSVRILRPISVCVPASVDGVGIVDAEHYLACYKARDAVPFTARDVGIENALATHTVYARKGEALCVPSTRF